MLSLNISGLLFLLDRLFCGNSTGSGQFDVLMSRSFCFGVFLDADSESPHMTKGKNASFENYGQKTVLVT